MCIHFFGTPCTYIISNFNTKLAAIIFFMFLLTGHSTLTFDTELIELEKRPVMARSSIQNILAFAIWPAIIIGVLYLLYKRIAAADETIKANKKSRKKKH